MEGLICYEFFHVCVYFFVVCHTVHVSHTSNLQNGCRLLEVYLLHKIPNTPTKETSKTFNYAVTKINRWEHILFTAGIYSQPVTDSLAQKLPIRIIEVMPD